MALALSFPRALAAEHRFFLGMAGAIALAVFIGFARSFYLRPLFPAMPVPTEPIFVVHGVVFTGWVALLCVQTALVAGARTDLHRKLGLWGVILALAVLALGIAGALVGARRPGGFIGIPLPPLQFLAIPLASMAMFAVFVALGVARRRDPPAHKRFMLLASLQLVPAAIARWPIAAGYGPPAFFGITDLFVVALALWDWRSRGRLHPVTLWGGLATIVAQPVQLVVSGTPGWLALARWLTGAPG